MIRKSNFLDCIAQADTWFIAIFFTPSLHNGNLCWSDIERCLQLNQYGLSIHVKSTRSAWNPKANKHFTISTRKDSRRKILHRIKVVPNWKFSLQKNGHSACDQRWQLPRISIKTPAAPSIKCFFRRCVYSWSRAVLGILIRKLNNNVGFDAKHYRVINRTAAPLTTMPLECIADWDKRGCDSGQKLATNVPFS